MPAGRKRKHHVPEDFSRIDSYMSNNEIKISLEAWTSNPHTQWNSIQWAEAETPFHGYRRYFYCPQCGARCRYLYIIDSIQLCCGKCANIGYGSSHRARWYKLPDLDDPEGTPWISPREKPHKKNPNRVAKAYRQMGYGFTDNIPELPNPPDPPKETQPQQAPTVEQYGEQSKEAQHWTVYIKDGFDQEEAPDIIAIVEYVLSCMYPTWERKFRQYGYELIDDNRTAHTIILAKLPVKEPEPEEPEKEEEFPYDPVEDEEYIFFDESIDGEDDDEYDY